jgi:hypothetical protein
MLTLRKIPPSLPLLPYVRHYEYREILSEFAVAMYQRWEAHHRCAYAK